ncbi:hypothetical protein SUGI_0495420 [Cryptomeria japonica]|nr:hypothetical protein SUGI_0495420 [Cryptomeria japonica]
MLRFRFFRITDFGIPYGIKYREGHMCLKLFKVLSISINLDFGFPSVQSTTREASACSQRSILSKFNSNRMSQEFSNDSSKYFKRVVRLMARAFYDEAPALEKKLKPGQSDNRGLGVLILDRLTNVHWVKEEDLVNMLNVHRKQVTSLLHFFHREKLINLEYRKEEIKISRSDDDPSIIDVQNKDDKGQEKNDNDKKKGRQRINDKHNEFQEKKRFQTMTYISIDYAQIYDVLRYRLHHMNKKLSFNHDNKRDVQESYVCSKCEESYDVFTAMENNFCCIRCNDLLKCANASEILDERDELKIQLRQKVEEQLRPINNQLQMLKDLPPPQFVSLQEWQARSATSNEQADVGVSDIKEKNLEEKPKVVPPWRKREDMNLNPEQSEEIKASNESSPSRSSQDLKPTNNAKTVDEDYVRSYYAQLTRTTCTEDNSGRIVGEKSKREESDEEESECDDPFETGNYISRRKEDSEKKANESHKEEEKKGDEEEDDEDDGIEWE